MRYLLVKVPMLEHQVDQAEPEDQQKPLNGEAAFIKNLILEKKLYLRSRYSLDDLSRLSNIPRHRLSTIFNNEFGVSFPSFLNIIRVAHLAENIGTPQWRSYTLEGIGRECGFNSRNTMIKSIKRFAGQNPSVWVNSIRKNLQ